MTSSKTAKSAAPATRASVLAELRGAISAAEAQGIARDAMVLRLTHRDDAMLKRSPDVTVDEIAFADGRMRFLGVLVETGEVTVSRLDTAA